MITKETMLTIEESADRLKITIPLRINWLFLTLFSLTLLVWLAMVVVIVLFMLRGGSDNFVLYVLLFIWLLVWFFFGRSLWRRWQYFAANREIIFIDDQFLIVRRPVSLLGLTTTYDRGHISPFYFSDKHHCPAFDYAYHHVYFGRGLSESRAKELVADLNGRYFPDLDEQDEW